MIRGLSFDISRRNTGIIYWEGDLPVEVHEIQLPLADLGEQIYKWNWTLSDLLWRYQVPKGDVDQPMYHFRWQRSPLHWIAYEDVRAVSKRHGMIQFGQVAILAMLTHRWQIPLLPFAQTTVKKALTGSGRADKEEMIRCAKKMFPALDIPSADVADAVGVGLAFLDTQKGPIDD